MQFTCLVEKNIPTPYPIIRDDPRLPADFKEMAQALHRSKYYPLDDSLLVRNNFNFKLAFESEEKFSTSLPVNISFEEVFLEGVYKDGDCIVNYVNEHLELHYQKSQYMSLGKASKKFEMLFSTLCHVLQSSGYGKSRMTWELGKKVPLIYTSLMDGKGFPGPSVILKMLLKKCKYLFTGNIDPDEGCGIVYAFFCRLFLIILSSKLAKDGPQEKFSCDECVLSHFENENILIEDLFDSIFFGLEELRGVQLDIKKPIKLLQKFEWKVNGVLKLVSADVEADLIKKVNELKKKFKSQNCPLIFVVDEAQALLYDYSKGNAINIWNFRNKSIRAFNVFLRVFRHFLLFWDDIWPLFLSTNGKISNFLAKIAIDDSRRPAQSSAIIPPIELVQPFGVHLGNIDEKVVDNWHDYLMNSNRIMDLFKCGRPLIYSAILSLYEETGFNDEELAKPYRDCPEVDFLRGKIFSYFSNSEAITEYKEVDSVTKFTILGLSVAFDAFPRNVNLDEMVASHMMTLIRYDNEEEKPFAVFPPEGVLNGIASWYLVYQTDEYLTPLGYMVHNSQLNVGFLGGTLAKINLVHASISANARNTNDPFEEPIRKQISSPVDLKVYLKFLTGSDVVVNDYMEANPDLKGSLLGFSYFQKWEDDISKPQEVLRNALIRGCALDLNKHYQGIDLLLPLVLSDGRLSFVAVQVKLWRGNKLSTANIARIEALHKACAYSNIFPKAPILSNPPPYAILLINLFNKNGEDKSEF